MIGPASDAPLSSRRVSAAAVADAMIKAMLRLNWLRVLVIGLTS